MDSMITLEQVWNGLSFNEAFQCVAMKMANLVPLAPTLNLHTRLDALLFQSLLSCLVCFIPLEWGLLGNSPFVS